MKRMRTNHLTLLCAVVVLSGAATAGRAQDASNPFEGRLTMESIGTHAASQESYLDRFRFDAAAYELSDTNGLLAQDVFGRDKNHRGTMNSIVRGQSSEGGGGSGAAAATDPSVPLTQLQLQNSFIPSTYGADGYSNVFVVQPVIPLNLNWDGIPYHIIRPTLPVISPTADPDGPLGVEGGLGDLTIIDVYVHPMESIKTNIGVGPVVIAPTSSHAQLGLGEWQLGPTVFVVSRAVPKWNLGALVQVPFSMESDAYAVQAQPIIVRTLPNEWYVGSGDLLWKFDDQSGGYDIPLSVRVGKVQKFGGHLLNIFLQPQYTPRGFHSGGTAEWGIKLNITFLFPDAKFTDPLLAHDDCHHSQPGCGF